MAKAEPPGQPYQPHRRGHAWLGTCGACGCGLRDAHAPSHVAPRVHDMHTVCPNAGQDLTRALTLPLQLEVTLGLQ